MFRKANQEYEKKGGPLAKQLFPSSSPSFKNCDGNIADHVQEKRGSTSYFASRRSQGQVEPNAGPSRGRSANLPVPNPRSCTGRAEAFASLQKHSGSFTAVDSFREVKTVPGSGIHHSAVIIEDGDFSDDNTLDLEYQAPSALPRLPREYLRAAKPLSPDQCAVPAPASSTLSWSQSSPSHFQEPDKVQPAQLPFNPSKRTSVEGEIAPPPKKRALPPTWSKKRGPEHSDLEEDAAFNAAKSKRQSMWDVSASAIKDQRRHLKNHSKHSEVGETPEHTTIAVKSHSPNKNTAISLSSEQQRVLDLVVNHGKSVFFTGPAGTGKSVLMRSIIKALKEKHKKEPDRVAVTASTGLAACNIGGMTLHSFAGIGLGKEDVPTLVRKIRRTAKAKNKWLRTKILIVDEISMVDGDLFDKLSQIGRIIRNNGRPWGGIQLVITGDFFQLPPVGRAQVKFAFDAATWNTSIDHTIGLNEIFRQKDPEFAEMLNEMRLGRITPQTVLNFQKLKRPLQFDDGIEVTELFPTRDEVDRANQAKLKALKGEMKTFASVDTGDPDQRDRVLQNMMAPQKLELKVGAQVMLIKNMDDGLVNGTLGTVTDFQTEISFQLKADSSMENPDLDVDQFAKRMEKFKRVLAPNEEDDRQYPLVQFHTPTGESRSVLCVPEDWKVELPNGQIQAARKQLPLILAWALSIHKAQGQTLDRVKVDLGRVFEKGQAYVALSRATTQQGLQVLRFQKEKVMAHPRVIVFYNSLYSVQSTVPPQLKQGTTSSSFVTKHSITPIMVSNTTSGKSSSSASGTSRMTAKSTVTKAPSVVPKRDIDAVGIDEDDEAALAAYG